MGLDIIITIFLVIYFFKSFCIKNNCSILLCIFLIINRNEHFEGKTRKHCDIFWLLKFNYYFNIFNYYVIIVILDNNNFFF